MSSPETNGRPGKTRATERDNPKGNPHAADLESARLLAEAGVPLFLAHPVLDKNGDWIADGGTSGTGYHLPKNWQRTTPDPSVVDRWEPGMALCAVMGWTVDAVDVDPRNGGETGMAALLADGMLPRSYGRQLTPSGGTHDLVRWLGVGKATGLLPGVDLQAGKRGTSHGFIFLAPTVKLSKTTGEIAAYRWDTRPDLSDLSDADTSGAALAEFAEAQRGEPIASLRPEDVEPATELQRTFAQLELAGIVQRVAELPDGRRHVGLYSYAKLAGGYVFAAQLEEDDWAGRLADAARVSGLDAGDAERTSKDGLRLGMAHPLPLPADDVIERRQRDGSARQHERFALRLAERYADRIMWVTGLGWFSWDGRRWAPDPDAADPLRCVAEVAKEALADAAEARDRELLSEARSAQTANGMRGILKVATSLPELRATTDDLDADPWLLNCTNGTVDLRTGELSEHKPSDRLTRLTKAAWEPEARSDAWDAFLSSSLPDPAVRQFLQRYAGVSLIGRVIEHKLVMNTGEGRNGKGTFATAMLFALGDYSLASDPSMFLLDTRHPTRSAGTDAKMLRLRGARAVFMSEIDKGARLNESVMKSLTGGDRVEAKPMYGSPVEFAPSHSFFVAANDLPGVDADAVAVWARILVVPWNVSFLGREDKDLDDKLAASADAVLAWAWAGLEAWEMAGRDLCPPAAVAVATEQYKAENDYVQDFLDEECETDKVSYWTADSAIKTRYQDWARRLGLRGVPSARDLIHRLDERGFPATKRHTTGRKGIRLREVSDFDPADGADHA